MSASARRGSFRACRDFLGDGTGSVVCNRHMAEAGSGEPRHLRRHPSVTAERSHPADAERFYHDVAQALEGAEEILVVGPATAKLELIKHVHKHDHALASKIVGVETVDHPTEGELLKYVREYFRAADRTR